ncbi:SIS domain-containing protein [Actinoplanes bogorensis]|uniref:Glutamine--fructose-6-phosphate aminotransferase [isomerizing] n=1 Tax=Paractinoplanes bogorensis TaxID=1610840 RepID=A0ABS5YKT4_9ACTN|nr:SIS domain-containing protein [Actinoplanes bogorensis]MBU2662565.1 SIS domain-containing protein [Actinoplanes bogorensis]
MNPALFLADLEAKPAALRALAARLTDEDPWAFLGTAPHPGTTHPDTQHPGTAPHPGTAAHPGTASPGTAAYPGTPRRVTFVGMGSSRYAALVAARRLRFHGIDAVAEYASDAPPPVDGLLVAISASGTSVETLDAMAGRSYVAVTNNPDSPLARSATAVVEMHAGAESGGVACRSFQHTQLLLDALIRRLSDQDLLPTVRLIERTAAATEDLLERRDTWLPRVSDVLADGDGVWPIAPVDRISSALQSALMFREGPRQAADGCETGDWAHVDVYLTKTLRYRALLFPGSRYDEQALDWMRERKSTYVSVGDDVAGAAETVRFRHDDDAGVRLTTETLIAELVAAKWWSEIHRNG